MFDSFLKALIVMPVMYAVCTNAVYPFLKEKKIVDKNFENNVIIKISFFGENHSFTTKEAVSGLIAFVVTSALV